MAQRQCDLRTVIMTKQETPQIWQIALLHINLSLFSGGTGAILGSTIAASTNGVSHVTKACGMGIAGCGASQHWAIWSGSLAFLLYVGIISSLIWGSTNLPPFADGIRWGRWVKSNLTASNESPRFKQWLVFSLLLGVISAIASAAIGGAVGGFVYGNFITGMGATNGVPLIGWFFGVAGAVLGAGLSAMLFAIVAGVTSGAMLRRQPRSSRQA